MPLVRVRILHGKTLLAAPSRPFAADATLQHVVGRALETFSEYSVNVLEVYPDADKSQIKKSQFFPDDFESITINDMPSEAQFKKLAGYLETVNYCCGDALFPDGLEGSDKKLAETFYNSEAITCRNDMELNYYN